MNRKLWFRTALIATPLLAFLLYAALNWYTIEETTVRTGMREEALRDPYLAYARLLQRMGTSAEFARSPLRLASPPERGILVLGPRRLVLMTPLRVRELEAWVRRGGLLVAQAEPPGIDDPLLERFGVEREPLPDWRKTPRPEIKAKPAPSNYVASVAWPGASKPLRVRQFGTALRLTAESEPADLFTARLEDKIVVAAFPAGAGKVVAVSDLDFLRNRSIADYEHAEFGWRLASDAPQQRSAMIFLRMESPSLLRWLVESAWPVLVAGAALLLAWLARIMPRFGPLAPEAQPVRRSLLEHLRAAGRFLWSRGEATHLLDALRDRVWRTALRRRGGLKGLAHSRAHAVLSELSGRPTATVQRAMQGNDTSSAAFVATAGALQEIESGLAHRARTPIRTKKGNPK